MNKIPEDGPSLCTALALVRGRDNMHGVMVSLCAFLVSHQCLSVDLSQLGLEFSGFSMWHFLKLIVRSTLVSSPPSSADGSAYKIKLK